MHLFTHPDLLAVLTVMPVLSILALLATRRRQRALLAMGGLVGGVMLLRQRPSRLRGLCLWLGLVSLGVGMAGPRWGRDWTQSAAPGRDLVVVVDVSRSMYAEAPSRIERAQKALLDLADALRRRGGCRVGLVAFAGQARLVCPLTHDIDHFRSCIEEIDVTVPESGLGAGTRIGAGLVQAVEAHEGRSQQARDILLLSDGDDPARDGEWRRGIERARQEGIAISCVGLGEAAEGKPIPAGSGWLRFDGKEVLTRLEEAPLREIARRTGGELILAGTRPFALGEHYLAMAQRGADEDSPDQLPVKRQQQAWFLVPAFVLLSLTLVLPDRRKRS
jgi:Ca-activated chloride channel family protein